MIDANTNYARRIQVESALERRTRRHSGRAVTSVAAQFAERSEHAAAVSPRRYAELALERNAQQRGAGEAAAPCDFAQVGVAGLQERLRGVDASPPDLFHDGSVEDAAESALEALPAAPYGARDHRHVEAAIGVLADPADSLRNERVVYGQSVRRTPSVHRDGSSHQAPPVRRLPAERTLDELRRVPAELLPGNHHARKRRREQLTFGDVVVGTDQREIFRYAQPCQADVTCNGARPAIAAGEDAARL